MQNFYERMQLFASECKIYWGNKLFWEKTNFCEWMQNIFGSTKLIREYRFLRANSKSLGNVKHLHENKFLAVNVSWGNKNFAWEHIFVRKCNISLRMQHFERTQIWRVLWGMQNFCRRTNYSGQMQTFFGWTQNFFERVNFSGRMYSLWGNFCILYICIMFA